MTAAACLNKGRGGERRCTDSVSGDGQRGGNGSLLWADVVAHGLPQ
jgi:hypothetical protein